MNATLATRTPLIAGLICAGLAGLPGPALAIGNLTDIQIVDRAENRRLPASLEALVPAAMASLPMDPWNRPFVYVTTAEGYSLTSLGADGAAGGDGDAADWVVIDGAFAQDRR